MTSAYQRAINSGGAIMLQGDYAVNAIEAFDEIRVRACAERAWPGMVKGVYRHDARWWRVDLGAKVTRYVFLMDGILPVAIGG